MKKLLDVGCGSGGFVNLSYYKKHERDYEIHGIDFLEENIRTIKKQYKKGKFQVGDVQKLPFLSDTYDTVLARHVFEHVHNLDRALQEIKRVSKRSADLQVAVPHPKFESIMKRAIPHYIHEGHHHERIFNQKTLLRVLKKHRFKVVKVRNDKWPIFVVDVALALLSQMNRNVEMKEQTGVFMVNEFDYTKKSTFSLLYRFFYSCTDFANRIFPFMNHVIPFEIEIIAVNEK